jgi:hypothetical protein
MTKTCLQLFFW